MYWNNPLLILVQDNQQKYLMMRADEDEVWYVRIAQEEAEKLLQDFHGSSEIFKKSDVVYRIRINEEPIRVLESKPEELDFDYKE